MRKEKELDMQVNFIQNRFNNLNQRNTQLKSNLTNQNPILGSVTNTNFAYKPLSFGVKSIKVIPHLPRIEKALEKYGDDFKHRIVKDIQTAFESEQASFEDVFQRMLQENRIYYGEQTVNGLIQNQFNKSQITLEDIIDLNTIKPVAGLDLHSTDTPAEGISGREFNFYIANRVDQKNDIIGPKFYNDIIWDYQIQNSLTVVKCDALDDYEMFYNRHIISPPHQNGHSVYHGPLIKFIENLVNTSEKYQKLIHAADIERPIAEQARLAKLENEFNGKLASLQLHQTTDSSVPQEILIDGGAIRKAIGTQDYGNNNDFYRKRPTFINSVLNDMESALKIDIKGSFENVFAKLLKEMRDCYGNNSLFDEVIKKQFKKPEITVNDFVNFDTINPIAGIEDCRPDLLPNASAEIKRYKCYIINLEDMYKENPNDYKFYNDKIHPSRYDNLLSAECLRANYISEHSDNVYKYSLKEFINFKIKNSQGYKNLTANLSDAKNELAQDNYMKLKLQIINSEPKQ